MKTKKNNLIEYWLSDIKILKFTLSEFEDIDFQHEKIDLVLDLTGSLNDKENKVEITTEVKIYKEQDAKDLQIAELKVRTVFAIQNIDILDDDGEVLLPKSLLVSFNQISISTTRGILFTKFQGTNIDDILLPLIQRSDISEGILSKTN